MLANWRVKFNGANPLETLAKALQAVDIEVANELGKSSSIMGDFQDPWWQQTYQVKFIVLDNV